MAKKNLQEINAGSMADIAFLLLIFFLVTTTMDTDIGISRKLPPDNVDAKTPVVKERNVLTVLVNKDNKLMVEDSYLSLSELRTTAKEFIKNDQNNENLPELSIVDFPIAGKLKVTKNHVISLRSDRGTSYGVYIAVQNELTAAYNELREELSMEKWGVIYTDLKPEYKLEVGDIYPIRISEAEPSRVASLD